MKAEKTKDRQMADLVQIYGWLGNCKKSTRRVFNTKREAEEGSVNFMMSLHADFNKRFEKRKIGHIEFVNILCE